MSVSIVLRNLDRLVNDLREVEARFMFRGLASRNDTNVRTALGVRNRDDLIFQEPEGQETPLSVRFARILSGQAETAKDSLRVHEVDAVLAQIGAPLRLVPCDHGDCSY